MRQTPLTVASPKTRSSWFWFLGASLSAHCDLRRAPLLDFVNQNGAVFVPNNAHHFWCCAEDRPRLSERGRSFVRGAARANWCTNDGHITLRSLGGPQRRE